MDHMRPEQLLEELQLHGVSRLTLSHGGAPRRLAASAKAEVRRMRLASKSQQREMTMLAKEEEAEREAWLGRMARRAEEMSATVGGVCGACGERHSCMLFLCCGHASTCRECWEAQSRKCCGACGGEGKLALQLYRPLE